MLSFFTSPGAVHFPFTPGLPQGFKGPFLAGSQSYHYAGTLGSIVVQELAAEQFSLQFCVFHFLKKTTLSQILPQGLHSFFLHGGKVEWRQPKKRSVREGQFLLVSGTSLSWSIELNREKSVALFLASFRESMVQELAAVFQDTGSQLRAKAGPVLDGPHTASPGIRDTVHQLLYAGYEPYLLPFYFRAKVSEYLFLLLHKASHVVEEQGFIPSEWEKEVVFRVRDAILADLQQHHSIPTLARRFKINPLRLKVFFKQEFGVGPYAFLLNARLDRVKALMEQGMPMKNAAPMAGYRITSFITAFKRRYGYPPGALFRKNK